MSCFVFSDAHLGAGTAAENAQRLAQIQKLFERVRAEGDRLIILGDLFDYWFEYRHAIPRGHLDILTGLAGLRRDGIAIDYVCGNHDFWMLDFFPNELGIPIHRDAFDFSYQGKRIHCFHGDGLSRRDAQYRILKKIFRNPLGIAAFRLLPVDFATWLATGVSGESRKHAPAPNETDMADYREYAAAQIAAGADIVLLAHLHHPVREEIAAGNRRGIYCNSGDFIAQFSYVKIDDSAVSLEYLREG